MITIDEARARARTRLSAKLRDWACAVDGSEPEPCWSLGLQPPTEAEMRVDERAAERWTRDWLGSSLPEGVQLGTSVRTWRSIGRQTVPIKVEARTPGALSDFVGGSVAREYRLLQRRVAEAVERLGEGARAASRRHSSAVTSLSEQRWAQTLQVAAWLAGHSVVGLRPRSLPIRGVDSKWFAAHRALVTSFVTSVTGEDGIGVVDSDPLVRVRILDPSLAPGVADFAAPIAQLELVQLRPTITLILENRETLLAMPSMPGVVAVHGGGFAVSAVADLGWVQASSVLYWGDLDSAGFAILNRLRAHHSDVTSVLMDAETLDAHRDLWVSDPKPTRALLGNLTEAERRVYDALRAQGDVRLEQERIPLRYAIDVLTHRSR